jgi:hypothetical protein
VSKTIAVSTPVYMASHETVLFTTAGIQEYRGDFIKGSPICLYHSSNISHFEKTTEVLLYCLRIIRSCDGINLMATAVLHLMTQSFCQLLDRIQLAEEENRAVLSAIVSRGSGAHAHNEEDMLSLVKAQLLRQQLLMEGEEQLLFKHEAKNIYNIECSQKTQASWKSDPDPGLLDPDPTFHFVTV